MSWLSQLYKTYEYASEHPHVTEGDAPLMPYYHVKQNVQIIVSIDDKGLFLSAEVCRDASTGKVKSAYLTIPATNDSATRSGQIPPPHPLSDKVQYVAKDYFEQYADSPKRNFFDAYHELLSNWCASPHAHPKANAVLAYIEQGQVVRDLINAGVLIKDPNDPSKLAYPANASDFPDSIFASLNKSKGTFDQGSAFIAWQVVSSELDSLTESKTWQDDSLFTAWQNYYASLDSTDGFCYITGNHAPLASKHPNRILRSASNAKLISANDTAGFTFLGRFTDDDKSIKASGLQGANISAVVTEKAHAALSWLLARQGHEEAGQAVVAWAISGNDIPQPTQEQLDLQPIDILLDKNTEYDFGDGFDDDNDDANANNEMSSENQQPMAEMTHNAASSINPPPNHSKNLGQLYSKHLINSLHGYKQRLDAHDQISIISLDAATPGRMAVTYYFEAMPDDYLQALEDWYAQFSWYMRYQDSEGNHHTTIKPPTPKQIAQSAYGIRVTDAVKKQVVSQVLPCIVEGSHRQLPWQLFELCFKRACTPLNMEHWEWQQTLSTACALYRGHFARQHQSKQNNRSYTVALQEDYASRDYLYGRLLAVAEDIENLALYIAGEGRNTTAQRYMQQFANRPFSTWRNIELALKPYENRLKNNRGGYLVNKQKLIDSIMNLFAIDDFNNDTPLSGEFLLGYHSQKMQFRLDKEAQPEHTTEQATSH